MTLRRAFAALGLLGSVVAIAAASAPAASLLPACAALPGKTCFADRVNVYNLTDAGPDQGCTTCLQGHDCCDAVGRCDESPSCVTAFQATHACVLEGGAPVEDQCRGKLTDPLSQDLYACMREKCAPNCGVPGCSLNPSVTLIENPGCDKCLGSACCTEIDTCYQNRACKNVIQCITDRCPNSFGPSLTALGELGPDALERARQSVCAGGAPGVPIAPCLAHCLEDFAPANDGGTVEDKDALCLSFGVYACGARYKCGPSCVVPPGSPYANRDPFPEDLIDAGPPARDASAE